MKSGLGQLLCVALCVIGIVLFYDPAQKLDLWGGSLALLSGLAYAGYILLLSVFKYKEISGFKLSFYVAGISSVILLVICRKRRFVFLAARCGFFILPG